MRKSVLAILLLIGGCVSHSEPVDVSGFHKGERIGFASAAGDRIYAYYTNYNHDTQVHSYPLDQIIEYSAAKQFAQLTPLAPIKIRYDTQKIRDIYTDGPLQKPDDPARIQGYIDRLMKFNKLDYLLVFAPMNSGNFINRTDNRSLEGIGVYARSGGAPVYYYMSGHMYLFKRGETQPIGNYFIRDAEKTGLFGDDLLPRRELKKKEGLYTDDLANFVDFAVGNSVSGFLGGPSKAWHRLPELHKH